MPTKIAVITPLLPETTGVAEFSERVYGRNHAIDLFWRNAENAYDISSFYSRAAEISYDAIVFTLANSNHNFPTSEVLDAMAGFPGVRRKLILHIHDPVLTNVARHVHGLRGQDMLDHYVERDRLAEEQKPSDIYSAFERHGYTGLSALIYRHHISSIIVHSEAALELTRRDLGVRSSSSPHFLKLFHPCFDSVTRVPWLDRTYDVGIFGVADDGGKMTNRAINVLTTAHQHGVVRSAILCGYNAQTYAREKGFDRLPFLRIVENPTHEQMFELMSKTRVALQPRSINTGESSGVIPMLITANVRSIVSRVGSFKEYPDSLVSKVENSDFEAQCARLLPECLRSELPYAEVQRFVSKHSSARFIQKLFNHVDELAKGPATAPVRKKAEFA